MAHKYAMDESALHSGGMIIKLDSPSRQRRQSMSSPTTAPPGAVASDTQTVNSKQLRKWLAPLALGVLLLLIPAPTGLPHAGWRYFALFAAVIASLITEPLPGAAIGFFGVTIAAGLLLLGKTPGEAMKWALSGARNTRYAPRKTCQMAWVRINPTRRLSTPSLRQPPRRGRTPQG